MDLKDSTSEEQAFSEAAFIVENHSLRACSLSVRELEQQRWDNFGSRGGQYWASH